MEIAHFSGVKRITQNELYALDSVVNAYGQLPTIGSRNRIRITNNSLTFDFIDKGNLFSFHLRDMDDSNKTHTLKKIRTSAYKQWDALKDFISRKDVSFLIIDAIILKSNIGTEKVITDLPASMLGKLCVILLERYRLFNGDKERGMLILSTGDFADYAHRLEAHLLELAHINKIQPEFLDWIENDNYFATL